jgi:hypothetical protein
MMVVLALSRPIQKDRRNAFLSAVAGALAVSPVRGAGVAHRIAVALQREFRSAANVPDAPEVDGAPRGLWLEPCDVVIACPRTAAAFGLRYRPRAKWPPRRQRGASKRPSGAERGI